MSEIQTFDTTAKPPFARCFVGPPNRTLSEIKMARKPNAPLATPTDQAEERAWFLFETSRGA
jgi:hypothetical protein